MVEAAAPYIWLGPRWYAWLAFGPDGSHAAFERVADRLRAEFGAVAVEALLNPAAGDKEYLWLQVGPSRLLLMRRAGCGVGLGASHPDVPQLARVGAAFGASRRGWRWPLYDLWCRLTGRRGHGSPPAACSRLAPAGRKPPNPVGTAHAV